MQILKPNDLLWLKVMTVLDIFLCFSGNRIQKSQALRLNILSMSDKKAVGRQISETVCFGIFCRIFGNEQTFILYEGSFRHADFNIFKQHIFNALRFSFLPKAADHDWYLCLLRS